MKLASLWLMVVAVTAPTSSTALLPKYTPAGLINVTWPGALILPKIWLGLASRTRFKVAACALGWLKLTVPVEPTLKVPQLMTARCELWSMFSTGAVAVPALPIWAMPAATCPWVGSSLGEGGPAPANAMRPASPRTAASLAIVLTSELRLPRERAVSATTVQVAVTSLKTMR